MQASPGFNINRLVLLARHTVWSGIPALRVAAAMTAVMIILIAGSTAFGRTAPGMHYWLYPLVLFSSGLILSSHSFRELHNDKTATAWLLLPASSLEKFTCRLLMSSVGHLLVSLVFYLAVAFLVESANRFIFGYWHPLFNPFDQRMVMCAGVYLVVQAVFLVGAVYFRRFQFIKTVLFLSLLLIGLVVVAVVTARFSFGSHMGALFTYGFEPVWDAFAHDQFARLGVRVWWLAKILFWGVLAPLCWLITYFRLTEFEV